MRSEFEKNRYWIGLYRSDVDFDETIGEFGRYVANGSRSFDAIDLEAFNEKWEAYANAWNYQQSKVDELQKRVDEQTRHIEIALLAVKDVYKSTIDEFHGWDVINEKAPKLCEHLQNLSVAIGELEQAIKGCE